MTVQQHGRYGSDAARPGGANLSSPRSAVPPTGPSPRPPGTPLADIPAARARVRAVPEAAVARLAVYLQVLTSLRKQGVTTISSEELARIAGVNSAKLRKDLSYVGSYGTRGVGYDTARLIEHIERVLGLTRQHCAAVVGIGNLGHALANYGGFPGRGFPVAALFDIDEDLIGIAVGGRLVDHIERIPEVCAEREVTIGVICTPAGAAQAVCDLLVAGGVRCILNFAPIVLQVPDDVEVRTVDLAVELLILSFHEARRRGDSDVAGDARDVGVVQGVVTGVEGVVEAVGGEVLAVVDPAAERAAAPVVDPLIDPLVNPADGIVVRR